MTGKGLPKEFEPFSLDFEPRIQVYGTVEVESFTGSQKYVVDLEAQTCTCPNFQVDRLPYTPPNHLGRWCKHLVEVLHECGTLDDLDEWRAAMLEAGYGGPLFAFSVTLPTVQPMVVSMNSRLQWIDVYARAKRAGENMTNATGKIRRYGWHVAGHGWSYGEAPAGASELRPLLQSFNELTLQPIQHEQTDGKRNSRKSSAKSTSGCGIALLVAFVLFLIFGLSFS